MFMANANGNFAPFSLKKKKKKLTSLRKWLKGKRQKFDYLPFDVRINMGLNLSVLPDCLLCLGSADMYVAHILCRELHERVVYQLRRRRLLISLYSRNFNKQFFRLSSGKENFTI